MNEDKIIQKLIEMDAKLDNVVTGDDFNSFKREYSDGQDQIISILKRLDEERIFTIEWVKRIEADVARVKQALNIV